MISCTSYTLSRFNGNALNISLPFQHRIIFYKIATWSVINVEMYGSCNNFLWTNLRVINTLWKFNYQAKIKIIHLYFIELHHREQVYMKLNIRCESIWKWLNRMLNIETYFWSTQPNKLFRVCFNICIRKRF